VSSSRQVVYSNRTVVLTFTDPTLPYQLSKLVKVRRYCMSHAVRANLAAAAAAAAAAA
jgi:hypothetical protein